MAEPENPRVPQEAWRRETPGARLPRRRRPWRRIILAPIGLVVLAVLGGFFLRPFWQPRTHLVVLSAGEFAVLHAPPVPFADRESARFDHLPPTVTVHSGSAFDNLLASRGAMRNLPGRLGELGISERDTLIVYVSAHAVSYNGSSWLLCNDYDPGQEEPSGLYKLDSMLEALRGIPAAGRLLILNTGNMEDDLHQGLLARDLPRVVEESLQLQGSESETGAAPGLWVLTAHSQAERARSSRALRSTVFGAFVAKGLSGAADQNHDDKVDVGELARFVRAHVSSWVEQASAGLASQTPQLLPRRAAQSALTTLLSVRGQPSGARMVDIDQMITSAQRGRAASRPSPVGQPRGLINRRLASAQDAQQPDQDKSGKTGEGDTASEPGESSESQTDSSAPSTDGDNGSGGETTDSTEEGDDSERGLAPRLVEQVWRVRDGLSLESSVSPHLWRELNEELLDAERRWRVGTARDAQIGRAILEQTLELAGLQEPAAGAATFDLPAFCSLAMAKLLLQSGRLADASDVAPRVASAEAALDEFLREPPEDLAAWIAKNESLPWDEFHELRLLRQLAVMADVDVSLLRLAVETRRMGEGVAAHSIWGAGWLRPDVDVADRQRLAGERELRDQIGATWQGRARSALTNAQAEYRRAFARLESVANARRLRDELLFKAPYYLRWHAASGARLAKATPLQALLRELDQLAAALDSPSAEKISQIDQLVSHLQDLQREIEGDAAPSTIEAICGRSGQPRPTDGWDIELLLQSVFPSHTSRALLLRSANLVEENLARSFALPDLDVEATATDSERAGEQWSRRLEQCELEFYLARLAAGADSAELETALKALQAAPPDRRQDAFQQFVDTLAYVYRGLPGKVKHVRPIDERDAAGRTAVTAQRSLRLLDARQSWRVATRLPGLTLDSLSQPVDLYDLLLWQSERCSIAARDVPPDSVDLLAALGEAYRVRAGRLLLGAPSRPRPVRLELAIPSPISLANRESTDVVVTARNLHSRPAAAWVVVHYDPDALEMENGVRSETAPFYAIHNLRRQIAALSEVDEAASAPFIDISHPAVRRLRETFLLKPGETRDLHLRLGSKSNLTPASLMVVQVVAEERTEPTPSALAAPAEELGSAGAATTLGYQRREVAVALPALRLVVNGSPGTTTSRPRSFELHPFPNDLTRFRLGVLNTTDRPRRVRMRMLKGPDNWDEIVASGTDLSQVAQGLAEVQTAGGKPAWEWLVKPGETRYPGEAEEPQGEGEPDGAAQDPEPPAPADEQEEAQQQGPVIPLQGDIIVELNDAVSDQEPTYRRVRVTPQRPRRYVRPQVGYDMVRQRIEIDVRPRSELPPGKSVSVECEVESGLAGPAEGKLKGTIQFPDNRARLFVNVPVRPAREVVLRLNIDDYPRAFTFRVPCGEPSRDLPEWTEFETDEIVAVELDRAEQQGSSTEEMIVPPADKTKVELRVDAPVGSFETAGDVVLVGIDGNADGLWDGKYPIELKDDREVTVGISEAGENGEIVMDTRVSDWRVALPTRGLSNVTAKVVGKLSLTSHEADFASRPIGFDGAAPRIQRIQTVPSSSKGVLVGSEISIVVTAFDEMSGVKAVRVGFVPPDAEYFPEDAAPEDATPLTRSAGGPWLAKVTMGDLPGPQTLMVEAVDKVGQGSRKTMALTAITEQQQLALLAVDVSGVVAYRDEPVPAADVQLLAPPGGDESGADAAANDEPRVVATAASDGNGGYIFRGVKAGDYQLVARAVIRNVPRKAESKLSVTADTPPRLEVDLVLE